MNLKPVAKATVPVVLGVMVAGFLMYQFRDVGVIAQARAGYDM